VASTSGNYSVTVTGNSGCSTTAAANVYIKPVPVVNLGPDISQCGGSVTLDAGNSGATFLWSDGSTGQTLVVDSTGTYSVTVTSPTGNCPASDSVTVTINPVPTLNFGPSISLCGGTTTLDAINPGSAYNWSNGSTDDTLLVTSSGYYAVTVTNPDGCSVTAAQVVTINPVPPIEDDTAFNICPDTTANLLLLYPDQGYVTYSWTAPNPQAASAGTWVLTVVNEAGCSNSAMATINNFPSPILGPPDTIGVCPGNSTDLTAVYPNNGYATYNWNTQTPAMAFSGNYTLIVTNNDGCGNTVTATVDNYPKPNAGPDVIDSICPGTTINLDTVIVDTGYIIYAWNASNPLIAPAGIYTLVVTNNDGCTDTAIATIANYELPALSIPAYPNVCITRVPFPLAGAQPPGGVYTVDGDIQTIFDPGTEGIGSHLIIYTFTTYSGCVESVDTSNIVFPQPFITSILPPVLCTTSVPLNLNGFFTPPGGVYQGLGVSGYYFYSTLSPPQGDSIVDVYTDSNGCMDTASYFITVNPSVHVSFSASAADFTICAGQNITFTAGGAQNYQFFVNDTAQDTISTDSTFTTNTLSYHSAVYVVGSNLCSIDTSEEIIIDVIPPPVVSAGPDTTIQLGQSVQLQGVASGVTSLIYLWYPGNGLDFVNIPNPTYSGSDSVVLWFKATDTYGCSDSAQVTIDVNIPDNVLLPNIITPNGDGKNDVWKLNDKINLNGSHLVIFSRWGETVYEADSYNNDWGGTYKGTSKKLPDGTYYYVLSVPARNNHIYKGAISIISGEAK
jgi:gliding motility-associated-like protein